MPTQISGRVTLILAILFAALFAIFPSGNLKKPDLKPGIDMVGGTSLLYEIKTPEGQQFASNLAEQVMDALKKRVDPEGVRNLIWRPQGSTRLEIQMPLSTASDEATATRKAFADAQAQLDNTNVRVGEVLFAVQELKGEQRAQRMKQYEMGSESRAKLFGAMASVWDQLQAAKNARNAAEQARLEDEFDKLQSQVDLTNLSPAQLTSVLDLKNPQTRTEKMAELKKRFADFPQRLAAIDQFARVYADYSQVKGNIEDAADLKRLLRGSGVLEFHILADDLPADQKAAMVERLKTRGPIVQPGDEVRWYQVDRPEEFKAETIEFNEKHYILLYTTSDKSLTNGAGRPKWALESARPIFLAGERKVGFTFDPQGSKLFGELTGNNLKKRLAIVLDDKVISAPTIQSQIFGSGEISGGQGGFSQAEMNYLISTLNAGALPAQLTDEPITERTVGPQIGQDNLRAGLIACAFGLVVVAVFLIGYYYLSGAVAMVAVLMNMVLILGSMAALNATFTLPGIAGIVLTIGMAVDANVLIFERLREEQLRGLSLRMALRNAYDRAWYAIFDSNVTTAITAAFLYMLGSEEVKGFGLTLLLGIVSSMFTALFVTKTIFAILVDRFGITNLSSLPLTFPKWDKMLKPNIDWMAKAWAFYTFSAVFIIIGLVLFGVKWSQGQLLDIEFASGTSIQFELKQPMPIDQVRAIIEAKSKAEPQALPAPSVVSVGTNDKSYEIVTPNRDAPAVKRALLESLQGKLNLVMPSTFENVDRPFAEVLDQSAFPIEPSTRSIEGMAPESLRTHLGGVAFVLRNINPALPAAEIKQRIAQQRLQLQTGGSAVRYASFDVEASPDGRTALVMFSDPSFTYDRNDPIRLQQWTDELAGPAWNLIRDAINKPAELQKVTNFDAQIAGETQRDALVALSLSILAVMGFIWLRFGDLKFGTATVVALLHDTLFTLAAVGFAHYLANTFIGNALLIEPFRINLNLVAAVLTVMGYSMNDTVVVFDRIRENRGKFGHVDRNVVNDSINQTLSRTLLTGGTTILTIFVMYITGGSGIHGFTFALLVGILVGTYSSIAVASPILLIGVREQAKAGRSAGVGRGQLQGA